MNWKNNGEDKWVQYRNGKETGYTINGVPAKRSRTFVLKLS